MGQAVTLPGKVLNTSTLLKVYRKLLHGIIESAYTWSTIHPRSKVLTTILFFSGLFYRKMLHGGHIAYIAS